MRQLDSSILIRINRTDKDQILKSFGTNNVSVNRYHFTIHLSVIQNGYKRGEYEQQPIQR